MFHLIIVAFRGVILTNDMLLYGVNRVFAFLTISGQGSVFGSNLEYYGTLEKSGLVPSISTF